MTMRRYPVNITTAADGSATAYSARASGRLHAIHYIKNNFDSGVDFAITLEATGETVWTENNVNASTSRYPRVATHKSDGTAALYAAAGLGVLEYPGLGSDRVKIVISSGGNAKAGSFLVLVDG